MSGAHVVFSTNQSINIKVYDFQSFILIPEELIFVYLDNHICTRPIHQINASILTKCVKCLCKY